MPIVIGLVLVLSMGWRSIPLTIAATGLATWAAWQYGGTHFMKSVCTLSGRTEIFAQAWASFSEQPWIGSGSRGVQLGQAELSAHNTYLSLLAVGGVVGVILAAPLALQVFNAIAAGFRHRIVWVALVPSLAIEGAVQTLDMLPAVWIMIGLLLGLKVNLRKAYVEDATRHLTALPKGYERRSRTT